MPARATASHDRRAAAAAARAAAQPDRRGFLERLPKWLIVIPLLVQWLLLSLRYRSLTLPSAANPAITAGGLVGEGKIEYFRSMGEHALAATARHGALIVHPATATEDARRCMQQARIEFPIVAKPDLGWCGFGVRRINDTAELNAYLQAYPQGECLVLQAYIPFDGEAGVFYVRWPGSPRGRILGIALRFYPQVTGDGQSTVDQLVARDPRLRRLGADGLHESQYDGAQILPLGQRLRLATIGSTRVGGLYRDGSALITPALGEAIDAIARDMQDFHFGRFDIRYESEAALMSGTGFSIVEVNGAGSEAIEAWDPQTAPIAAFRKLFYKQNLLFRIAAENRRRGIRPIRALTLARLHLKQQALIPRYPPSN